MSVNNPSEAATKSLSLTVVVPSYRSPGTLPHLVDEVMRLVTPRVASLEFILVDDGSPDNTWPSIVALSKTHSCVRGLRLSRNYGQHNALLAGIRAASGDLILTMDDDLQNPPDQIECLLRELTADVDLVYGYPSSEPQTRIRNLASRATKRLMRVGLGESVNPRHSAFRLFRRSLISVADRVHDPFVSIDVLLSWATVRQVAVPVRFDVRSAGESGYTLRRLVRHALNMITGYGVAPLRIVTWLGMLSAALGFLLTAFVLTRFMFFGTRVQGFTFLAAAISFFSGAQLLGLGIIGEYLGRIHFRTMGRPSFLVSDRVDGRDDLGQQR